MAEFDSAGFSAVSAFFGTTTELEENPPMVSQDTRGRQGVGSKVKKSAPSDTVGRLLKVGKRRRSDDNDDEESLSHEHTNDDDEEEGRTAIAEKSTKTGPAEAVSIETKKKKKGKKERKLETTQGEETALTEEGGTMQPSPAEQGQNESKPKRKRHKVRSRQKNIRKDHRLAQHKPDHLILGRVNFQGRPLTAETRERLNLPPSRTSRQQHVDSEGGTHPTETTATALETVGTKLAVDDLLDLGEEQVSAAIVDKPKITKKKRKKSKYKNLA